MKKIFAIIISLLFVASVFGVALTMAQINCPGCPCESETYYNISRTSVHVGETFTLSIKQECYPSQAALEFKTEPGKFSETIDYDPTTDMKIENGWVIATFRALRPGTLTIINHCAQCDNDSIVVTITPKSTPMDKFMKMLGLGKYKK